jgi:hypothetical protein
MTAGFQRGLDAEMTADADHSQTPPADLKKLRLRYAGTCVACGAALPQGAQALYHAASKTVRCVACPGEPATTEAAPIDGGTAGASAQREHDRRAAKREAATRQRFGNRLGGIVLTLTDEPQSTRAWAKGARGEKELADALAGLPDVVTLHDRSVPGTRGNIDHLVIAPAGLFVVDAKHYEGRLRIRDRGGLFRTDNRLYVGGRDCSKLAENMGWQVKAVETLLASVEVAMPVTPVLCFIDVDWPLLFAPSSFRGVRLEDPKSLRKLITATPALDAAAIEKLARILAAGFPAK